MNMIKVDPAKQSHVFYDSNSVSRIYAQATFHHKNVSNNI